MYSCADTWMSQVDDKENKRPEWLAPKLSDPLEFDMDMSEKMMDEVDGMVEELDLPDINNEVGQMWCKELINPPPPAFLCKNQRYQVNINL